MVGQSGTIIFDIRAVLFTDGLVVDLNQELMNPIPGIVLTAAMGINDRGQIIARGSSPLGEAYDQGLLTLARSYS